MTNKEKFIKAVIETREPSNYIECKLCQIINKCISIGKCWPCPFSDLAGNEGCLKPVRIMNWLTNEKDRKSYYKRKVIEILKETPARFFTEEGWTYHRKLNEYIDKVYNKIKEEE